VLFFQSFQPAMVNFGPFIPTPRPRCTTTGGRDGPHAAALRLTRIVTRNTHLSAANTVATLDPDQGQYRALVQGGANVIMPNCNPFAKSKTD
jgi:biotin synthase